MKIKVRLLVRCDFSTHGMSATPVVATAGAVMSGTISSPALLEKGDKIALNRMTLESLCEIPSKLTLQGGKAEILVESRTFTLGPDGVVHSEILCALTLHSDSDLAMLPGGDGITYGYIAREYLEEYILVPLKGLGFIFEEWI